MYYHNNRVTLPFPETLGEPVVSSGGTMARKNCVERKRYPCTVKAPLESRFRTRSTTAKASEHSGRSGGAKRRIG